MHPDLSLQGIVPLKIALPETAGLISAEWKKLDENNMGEFGLLEILKQFLTKDRSTSLASAWSADRYAIFENQKNKRTLLVFRVRLGSDADAARFFGAYSELLESKYDMRTNLMRRPNFFSFDNPEDGVFLRCMGTDCLILEGSSRGVFDHLTMELGWPGGGKQIPWYSGQLPLQAPTESAALLTHSPPSSMDFTCHSQKPPISSLVSVKGPSIIVRCCPENLTRLPLELGCNPSPASITPAFTSSSLNLPMAAKVSLVFLVGKTPASESLSALTITITRIVKSPCGTVSSSELVSGPSRPAEPGLYLHVERRPAESTSSLSLF